MPNETPMIESTSISSKQEWEDTFRRLQAQRADLQTTVQQRHKTRAAKLIEISEKQTDGKLEVGMHVKVRREPPNRIGLKTRKKLDAPVREDSGRIIEINPNSGRRYTVQFENDEIVHVGRRWLKVVAKPTEESLEESTIESSPSTEDNGIPAEDTAEVSQAHSTLQVAPVESVNTGKIYASFVFIVSRS
jgi:hypothetical protein